MKIKNSIITILIFLTLGCGYTPIYSNKNNNDFSIEKIVFNGDKTLNNFLKMNLKQFKKQDSLKKISIEIESSYEKNILTKDSTGKISNYELVAEIIFIIKPDNKKLIFVEKKIMESMSDKFEERKYEKIVKQNFSTSFSNKLISSLITLK
jgi:hypothetical protein